MDDVLIQSSPFLNGVRLTFLYMRFYLDVKGRLLDTEKLFAYRASSRSFDLFFCPEEKPFFINSF